MQKMRESEYRALVMEDAGICRACGEECGPVEPDASNYPCEACGDREVFGVEQLLIMGEIEFTEEEEEKKTKTYYVLWTYIANHSDSIWQIEARSAEEAASKVVAGFSDDFAAKGKVYVFESWPVAIYQRGTFNMTEGGE